MVWNLQYYLCRTTQVTWKAGMLHFHLVPLHSSKILGREKEAETFSFQFCSQNSSFLPTWLSVVSFVSFLLKRRGRVKGAFTDTALQDIGAAMQDFNFLHLQNVTVCSVSICLFCPQGQWTFSFHGRQRQRNPGQRDLSNVGLRWWGFWWNLWRCQGLYQQSTEERYEVKPLDLIHSLCLHLAELAILVSPAVNLHIAAGTSGNTL